MSSLTSLQKAASVVVSLGSDKASQIFKYLSEEEVELLSFEVAQLRNVTADQSEEALDDFYKMCLTQKVITDGGVEYARDVLEKAFGVQTANNLLDRITKSLKTKAFEFIRKADCKSILAVISNEHPQIIALVLSYANPDQAAIVLSELPKEKRISVVERIAKMESAQPEMVKLIEKALEKKFENVIAVDYTQIGGINSIADIMNNMDRSNEKFIFDELGRKDAKLTDDIRKMMFVFEDILSLEGRDIQKFLRQVDQRDLVYALKGSNQEVSNVIFANMSQRMAETIRSDIEITYNVRLKDVEEAQQRIVGVVRQLEEQGEIVISKGGKDEIIA